MARGRRGLVASQAVLSSGQWTAKQLTRFVQAGQLGEAKSEVKVEKYDPQKLKNLLRLG